VDDLGILKPMLEDQVGSGAVGHVVQAHRHPKIPARGHSNALSEAANCPLHVRAICGMV
jgi:hypothetical protein